MITSSNIEYMTSNFESGNEMYTKSSRSLGDVSSSFYDSSPEYLQKWIEGYALLTVIIVGATANLFSLVIIRNKELNLIRDFSRLLQSQVCFIWIDYKNKQKNLSQSLILITLNYLYFSRLLMTSATYSST